MFARGAIQDYLYRVVFVPKNRRAPSTAPRYIFGIKLAVRTNIMGIQLEQWCGF